jgi:hypothetical protein
MKSDVFMIEFLNFGTEERLTRNKLKELMKSKEDELDIDIHPDEVDENLLLDAFNLHDQSIDYVDAVEYNSVGKEAIKTLKTNHSEKFDFSETKWRGLNVTLVNYNKEMDYFRRELCDILYREDAIKHSKDWFNNDIFDKKVGNLTFRELLDLRNYLNFYEHCYLDSPLFFNVANENIYNLYDITQMKYPMVLYHKVFLAHS